MFILPLGPGHKTPRFGFVGVYKCGRKLVESSSGFSSKKRVNLSPFTKDFRGEEQHNECLTNFLQPSQEGVLQTNVKVLNVSAQSNAT